MTKKIILLSQFDEVQKWLINYLHDNNVFKIAIIINAKKPRLESDPEYVIPELAVFEATGITCKIIDLDLLEDNILERALQKVDALYVKGGNSFHLLKSIKASGLDSFIANLVDRGLMYIGESAGAYVACPTIEMANWNNQDNNIVGLKDLSSLSLVPFLVTAHYRKENEAIISAKSAESKFEVKRLSDIEAIVLEGDKETRINIG